MKRPPKSPSRPPAPRSFLPRSPSTSKRAKPPKRVNLLTRPAARSHALSLPRPVHRSTPQPRPAEKVLENTQRSLLDLVDNLLTRGVLLDGDVMLGVAKVDLVYLRLTAVLCAADRLMPRNGR
jgi:hypothetical protein